MNSKNIKKYVLIKDGQIQSVAIIVMEKEKVFTIRVTQDDEQDGEAWKDIKGWKIESTFVSVFYDVDCIRYIPSCVERMTDEDVSRVIAMAAIWPDSTTILNTEDFDDQISESSEEMIDEIIERSEKEDRIWANKIFVFFSPVDPWDEEAWIDAAKKDFTTAIAEAAVEGEAREEADWMLHVLEKYDKKSYAEIRENRLFHDTWMEYHDSALRAMGRKWSYA